MARKKKGNGKGKSKLCETLEYVDNELQERMSLLNVQQQQLEYLDRGKGRADPRLSHSPDNMQDELALYQPHYEEDPLGLSMQQHPSQQASTSALVQYPPQVMLREGPSGSFFEGSSNVEIKGGKFNQTYGHHTNVTIHVNHPREDEYDMPPQHSYPPSIASPTRTPSYNIARPDPHNVHHGQFPDMAAYEQGPSTSTTTTIYAPDNSNKIYERHLGLKQRGFPLWIPEPNRRLPMPYRRKGVHVGDVGIITPSGAFSFLFNICLPLGHPINPRTMPEGYAPIYPPVEPMDIREYSEFKPESYLASTAIEKIHNDPPFRGLSFMTSAAEGAVLTLPDGAIALDLENIPKFRAYAAANIENWYRYVNGPRGREAKNGEVRLVIGCDKATSWGMAAVANLSQHKTHYLKWRSVADSGTAAVPAPIPLYKWEYTGLAEARVGPDLPEIAELKRNDDSDAAVDGKYWNQCLFMRTLNLTLSDGVFEAISRELEAALVLELQRFQKMAGTGNSTAPSNSGAQTSGNGGQQSSTNTEGQSGSASESLIPASEQSTAATVVQQRVTTSRSPSAPKSHPADVLNKLLLQQVPSCRVVITQDEDWCSALNDGDEIMPSPTEIAERVLATHHIREEDGVVFLEPKMERQSVLRRRQIAAAHSAQGQKQLQTRIAGSARLTTSMSSALRSSELAWRPPSRTGVLNTSSTSDAPSNAAIRLQVLSGPETPASPSTESLQEMQSGRHRTSKISRSFANLRIYFAILAMLSLLVQAIQLRDISPRFMAFLKLLELAITFVFDVEVLATAVDAQASSDWATFFQSTENRIDVISAVISTIIQIPVIHHSRVYSWLSFAEMLRLYRVPVAIPRVKRVLICISGDHYRKLNIALYLVVGNSVGAIYLLRNVMKYDSFGPELPNMSHGELLVVAFWGLCLLIGNVFAFKVFRAIYLGKIEAFDQYTSTYRIPELETRQSRFSLYASRLREWLQGIESIPMYSMTGSDERVDTLELRSVHGAIEHTRIGKSQNSIAVLCRLLVTPPRRSRTNGISPSPVLQPLFEAYILLAISSNIVVSCIATPIYRSQYSQPILQTWFGKMDLWFVSSLLFEFIVKTIADGLYATPNGYFLSARNLLDFIVLFGSEYNFLASLVSAGSVGTFARSLRALCVLRLLTTSSLIRNAYNAYLTPSADHAFDAIILSTFYILPYGIWNIIVFSIEDTRSIQDSELDFALFNFMPWILLVTLMTSILERISLSTANIFVTKRQHIWKEIRVYLTRQTFVAHPLYRKPTSLLGRFFYDAFHNRVWSIMVSISLTAVVTFFLLEILNLALYNDPSQIFVIAYCAATVIPLVDVFVRARARYHLMSSLGTFVFNAVMATGNFGYTLLALYFHQDKSTTALVQGIFLPSILFRIFYRPRGLKMFINVMLTSFSAICGSFALWLAFLIFNIVLVLEVFGVPQPYMEVSLRTNMGHIMAMLTLWGSGKNWIQYIDICDPQVIPSFSTRPCNSRAWAYALFISWTFINTYICVKAYTSIFAEKFCNFSQFFGKTPDAISKWDIRKFKLVWAQFCNRKTGLLERQRLSLFFSRLTDAFEIRIYPQQYSVQNILRSCRLDRTTGFPWDFAQIDPARLNSYLLRMNKAEIKERKRVYARVYHESKYQTRRKDGISFTQMLLLVVYHKFVGNNSEYLSLQEIVERSSIDKDVHDLIHLDKVHSFLRMIVYRRRFLQFQQGRKEYADKSVDPPLHLLSSSEDTGYPVIKPLPLFKVPKPQFLDPIVPSKLHQVTNLALVLHANQTLERDSASYEARTSENIS